MRVLCIDSYILSISEVLPIIEGNIYTVIGEDISEGKEYYIFQECGNDNCYLKKQFIPVQDIDETADEHGRNKEEECLTKINSLV